MLRLMVLLAVLLLFASIIAVPVYMAPPPSDPFILIAIKETWGVSRYNYTIPIVIDSNNFKYWNYINTTNIYFTLEDGTPLYYWIEYLSLAPSSYYGRFWVRIPYIPAYGTVYIEMHFGGTNPYTSYDNASKVFIFWRDFSTGLGANATTYITDNTNDYITASNDTLILYCNGNNTYGSAMIDWNTGISLQDTQIIFEAYWDYAYEQYPLALVYIGDGSTLTFTSSTGYTITLPNHAYGYAFFSYNSTLYKFNDTVTALVRGASVPSGYSYTVVFTRHGAGLVGQNGIQTLSAFDTAYTNATHIGFLIWDSNYGNTTIYTKLVVNWVAVRRFVAPDPTVTIVNGTTSTITVVSSTSSGLINVTLPVTTTVTIDSWLFMAGLFMSIASYYFALSRKYRLGLFLSLATMIYFIMMIPARMVVVTGYTIINSTKVPVYGFNNLVYLYVGGVMITMPAIIYIIYRANLRKIFRYIR